MKKVYLSPQSIVVDMETTEMLAVSLNVNDDDDKVIKDEKDIWTNKKDMNGKDGIWD